MRVRRLSFFRLILFVVAISGLGISGLSLSPASALAQDVPPDAAPPIPAEDQIVLAGTVSVPQGERVGEVVVFSGSVDVEGLVTGDVVILEGPVVVTGQVNGSVIAADGIVRLGESARVGGDVLASESIRIRPGAEVRGEARGETRFSLEAPLAVLGKLLGPVAISISVLLMGLVLVWLAPRGADAVAEALSTAPLASLGWGILLALTVPVTAVALVVSVLGLPLGLALFLSFGLWWLVGLTWAAWCAGRGLVRAPHGSHDRPRRRLGGPRRRRAGPDRERRRVDAGSGPRTRGDGRRRVARPAGDRALRPSPSRRAGAGGGRGRSGDRLRAGLENAYLPGAPGAASAPTIIAKASSSDAPLLRSTIATSARANSVNRSTSVDIAAIDGRRTLRSELNT